MLFCPFDAINNNLLGGINIAPAFKLCPFAGFQILVMLEKMLNLLRHDGGKVVMAADFAVIRECRINGYGDQLLITALVILHQQHANRTDANNGARNNR